MYYVYVLQLNDGTHYIGSTSDLKRRLREHIAGRTRSIGVRQFKLLYYEAYLQKTQAARRE